MSLINLLIAVLTNARYFWTLATPIIIGDTILTAFIASYVPYTEIDWKTYVVQTEVYLRGERNYSLISGPTGPVVYPAGHIHVHQLLYPLTDSGRDIRRAQYIYSGLYILTLILTCNIYHRARRIPNWVILLLPLSKRLHSIFSLRLFNDCWCVLGMQAATLAYQYDMNNIGTLLFSAALSVKMSVLLYLPGLLVVLFKRLGLVFTLAHLGLILLTQIMLALPFLLQGPGDYLRAAFDFGRVFLYKWTVNWRFLHQVYFLHPGWAYSLFAGHLLVLTMFGVFQWCSPDNGVLSMLNRGIARPLLPAAPSRPSADYIATVLFTSNLIGILFARSLHYQFYAWYAQQVPFLLWRTRYPVPVKLVIMIAIEYAWNVFPSTPLSSGVLFGAHFFLLAGIWFGYPYGVMSTRRNRT